MDGFSLTYAPSPRHPGAMTVQTWIGSSDYNALQVKAERRFTNRVALLLSYTHSTIRARVSWL
jgi:hypothetical protein